MQNVEQLLSGIEMKLAVEAELFGFFNQPFFIRPVACENKFQIVFMRRSRRRFNENGLRFLLAVTPRAKDSEFIRRTPYGTGREKYVVDAVGDHEAVGGRVSFSNTSLINRVG